MEDASYHRHDIEDRSRDLIKDLLPGQRGQWGGVAEDNRRFVNAVFWVLRTGAPWRDLPPDCGGWKNTHRRFCRWRDKGVWERLLVAVVDDPGFERPMVGSACVRARRGAAGAVGGTEAVGRTKGGANTEVRLAVDAHGMPVRFSVAAGAEAGCRHLPELVAEPPAKFVPADRACDADACPGAVAAPGAGAAMPPKRNRVGQRPYDGHTYKLRHLAENAFEKVRRRRDLAARCCKRASSFEAAFQIRCLTLWLHIL